MRTTGGLCLSLSHTDSWGEWDRHDSGQKFYTYHILLHTPPLQCSTFFGQVKFHFLANERCLTVGSILPHDFKRIFHGLYLCGSSWRVDILPHISTNIRGWGPVPWVVASETAPNHVCSAKVNNIHFITHADFDRGRALLTRTMELQGLIFHAFWLYKPECSYRMMVCVQFASLILPVLRAKGKNSMWFCLLDTKHNRFSNFFF